MKLVAGLLIHNELGRLLGPALESLTQFCDEVRVIDDGSTDQWQEAMLERPGFVATKVTVQRQERQFFEHEGRVRNALMQWVLDAGPTHILATDADEFITDGDAVRAACEGHLSGPGAGELAVWTLPMVEVWKADVNRLWARMDGGWKPHGCPVLYSVPPQKGIHRKLVIADRALACGRQPEIINRMALGRKSTPLNADILHFGWTREAERAERYERYAVNDGGRFHASTHLRSIMWPDNKVRMAARAWPPGMMSYREEILARVNS